jgi:peroxiredoxin
MLAYPVQRWPVQLASAIILTFTGETMVQFFIRFIQAISVGVFLAGGVAVAGEAAPDFTLRDINGQQVSLSSFKGKVVLLNFWATWCGPCKLEMPHLDKMDRELEEKGFEVISISTDDARASSKVKPLVKRGGYGFTVLLDKETTVVSQYNPAKTLPYNVLIDRTGAIHKVFQGYNPGDEVELRAEVESLLEGGE